MVNNEKPPISDWTPRAAYGDSAMPERARWLNDMVWACEINKAPGHGYAWIVWDAGAEILAENTAPTQEDAERDCDAAAAGWYTLPPAPRTFAVKVPGGTETMPIAVPAALLREIEPRVVRQPIEAVKRLRQALRINLYEAKQIVDELRAEQPGPTDQGG